jgi:hypothetical protein
MNRGRCLAAATAMTVVLLAPGCGDESRKKIVPSASVQASHLERYPPGDPARMLLELVRLVQANDPTAAARLLTPAWGVSPAMLASAMPQLNSIALGYGVPRFVSIERQSQRARIKAIWGNLRPTVFLVSTSRGWQLARVTVSGRRFRVGSVVSP